MKTPTLLRSTLEWVVAAGILVVLGWSTSELVHRWVPERTGRAADPQPHVGAGVPRRAITVALLLLGDGREIRIGLTHAELETVLPPQQGVGPPRKSRGPHGERVTQAYAENGRTFFVTCERLEPDGAMYVVGIHLP